MDNVDKYEREIILWTENLKNRLLDKYRRGKIEHGGEPFKIDANKEIAAEIIDIINYHIIGFVNLRPSSFAKPDESDTSSSHQ